MEKKEKKFSKIFQGTPNGDGQTINPLMDDTHKDSARLRRGSSFVASSPPPSRRFSVIKRDTSKSSITQPQQNNNTTSTTPTTTTTQDNTTKKKGSWVKIQSEAFDSLARRNSLDKDLSDPHHHHHSHHNNNTHHHHSHNHTHTHHHHHGGGSGILHRPPPDEAPEPGIVAKRKMSFNNTTTSTTTTTHPTQQQHLPTRKLSSSEEVNNSPLAISRKTSGSGIRMSNEYNNHNTTGTTTTTQGNSSSPQRTLGGGHTKLGPIKEEPSLVEVIQQTRSHLVRVGRPSMLFSETSTLSTPPPTTATTTTTTSTITTGTNSDNNDSSTQTTTTTTPSHVKFSLSDTTIPTLPLAQLKEKEAIPEAASPSGVLAGSKKKEFKLVRNKGKTVVVLQRPKSARELRSSHITPPLDRTSLAQTLPTPTSPTTPGRGWVRSNFSDSRRFSSFTLGSARPSFLPSIQSDPFPLVDHEVNLPEPPPHPLTDELNSSIATALYEFKPEKEGDLAFKKGDRIVILVNTHNWWQGRNLSSGEVGIFPSNFVTTEARGSKVLRRALTPPELLKLPPPVDS